MTGKFPCADQSKYDAHNNEKGNFRNLRELVFQRSNLKNLSVSSSLDRPYPAGLVELSVRIPLFF
jgi:hypothetical protein